MEKDKDKWIEDVLGSMKGSQRAKPNPQLFAKIERQVNAPEAKIIPMRQGAYSAAAAILLIMLNVFALRQFSQNNESGVSEMVVSERSDQSLISNFKIYE